MNDKYIKQLAMASYTKEMLDGSKVNKIVRNLNQSELKKYIKAIKILEKQKTVYVYLAGKVTLQDQKEFQKLFPNKTIIINQDKSLIAGLKVVDNDLVFEQNIKNNLNNLVGFISQ